jgi:hypothetical protein
MMFSIHVQPGILFSCSNLQPAIVVFISSNLRCRLRTVRGTCGTTRSYPILVANILTIIQRHRRRATHRRSRWWSKPMCPESTCHVTVPAGGAAVAEADPSLLHSPSGLVGRSIRCSPSAAFSVGSLTTCMPCHGIYYCGIFFLRLNTIG